MSMDSSLYFPTATNTKLVEAAYAAYLARGWKNIYEMRRDVRRITWKEGEEEALREMERFNALALKLRKEAADCKSTSISI